MDDFHMSEAEKARIWELTRSGVSVRAVCRLLGRSSGSVREYMLSTGGVRPPVRVRAENRLRLAEREEIFAGLVCGESLRSIARRLGRAPSTISREVAHNGGRQRYRPGRADANAWRRACRPKPAKLATHHRLRAVVEDRLGQDWSPQQIAGWLAREFPDDPEMRVSHETIYMSLFVQARGALRRDLTVASADATGDAPGPHPQQARAWTGPDRGRRRDQRTAGGGQRPGVVRANATLRSTGARPAHRVRRTPLREGCNQ